MKRFIKILLMLIVIAPAHGYEICGPRVAGTEYSYSPVAQVAGDGIWIGSWAVGSGCEGQTDVTDVTTMCTSVVAGGQAFCGADYWGAYTDGNLDESTASTGSGCWCRRTKMMVGDALADSIGQWVLIGDTADNTTTCRATCAQLCAQNVAENDGNMRQAIMVLPAF